MHETYYTPEQLSQLEVRREEVGEDQIAAIEREWAELSAQLKAHRDAGTDPSDPPVRALAERQRLQLTAKVDLISSQPAAISALYAAVLWQFTKYSSESLNTKMRTLV
jgi:TipAS antibiotic-recognition domain